jgi:hypothetical protein
MPLITTSVERLMNGVAEGYLAGIIYLAPERQAGDGINVCKYATGECKKDCLYTSGRGQMSSVQEARIGRTRLWNEDTEEFYRQATEEIDALIRKAERLKLVPAIRLNGTSDIDHSKYIRWFNTAHRLGKKPTRFYDYSKYPDRCLQNDDPNYHITYSHGGLSRLEVSKRHLQQGFNVTVVFAVKKGEPLPKTWNGYRVIDGDIHDLRFLDPEGVVVGLRAKGRAKKTSPVTNGFVVPNIAT